LNLLALTRADLRSGEFEVVRRGRESRTLNQESGFSNQGDAIPKIARRNLMV